MTKMCHMTVIFDMSAQKSKICPSSGPGICAKEEDNLSSFLWDITFTRNQKHKSL